jgi:hypothetical protein
MIAFKRRLNPIQESVCCAVKNWRIPTSSITALGKINSVRYMFGGCTPGRFEKRCTITNINATWDRRMRLRNYWKVHWGELASNLIWLFRFPWAERGKKNADITRLPYWQQPCAGEWVSDMPRMGFNGFERPVLRLVYPSTNGKKMCAVHSRPRRLWFLGNGSCWSTMY